MALEIINQHNKGAKRANEEVDTDTIQIREELELSDDPMDDETTASEPFFDPNDDMDRQERERIIRGLIDQLGNPVHRY